MDGFVINKEAAVTFISVSLLCRSLLLSSSAGQRCETVSQPVASKWLNRQAFDTFVAICDTIIPPIDVENLTEKEISKACGGLFPANSVRIGFADMREIKRNGAFFQQGAVANRSYLRMLQILQRDCTPKELGDIAVLLSVLANPVGCLALTGYSTAFHRMSLKNRTNALHSLRDSSLQAIRGFFQVSICPIGRYYVM
jgi:hypothetical protein